MAKNLRFACHSRQPFPELCWSLAFLNFLTPYVTMMAREELYYTSDSNIASFRASGLGVQGAVHQLRFGFVVRIYF